MAAGFLYQPIILSAGVAYSLPANGLRVYYEDGVAPISVQVGDDFAYLNIGQGIKSSRRFDRVIIKSESNQTVKIYISDLGLIDNRINFASSSIEASIGNDTKNALVRTFIGDANNIEGALDSPAAVFFYNDSGSDLYCSGLQVFASDHSGGGSVNNQIFDAYVCRNAASSRIDAGSNNQEGNSGLVDKFDSGLARVGKFGYGSGVGMPIPGLDSDRVFSSRNLGSDFSVFSISEPFRLKNGEGIVLLNRSGGAISMVIEVKISAAAQNANQGLEKIVSNPTLPVVYNGFGFYYDLYGGVVGSKVLNYFGLSNAAVSRTDYSYEILKDGATLDLSPYDLEVTGLGVLSVKAGAADPYNAIVLANDVLTDVALKIIDEVDVNKPFWISPFFDWVMSNDAPIVPALASPRNWGDALKAGLQWVTYYSAAEDCEGRRCTNDTDHVGRSSVAFHGLPVRLGASTAAEYIPLSTFTSGFFIHSGAKNGSVAVHGEGYIPLLHSTTLDLDYVKDSDCLVFSENASDVWMFHSIKDWRSIDPVTGIPAGQQSDQPFGVFSNMRFYDPANDDTAVIRLGLNENASVDVDEGAQVQLFTNDGLANFSDGGLEVYSFSSNPTIKLGDNDLIHSGGGNGDALYADVEGVETYILYHLHKGIFQNQSGSDSHKISIWFGSTYKDEPFVFYLPIHANNAANLKDMNLVSHTISNANWFASGGLGFDSSIWSDSEAYDVMLSLALSQQSDQKNMPVQVLA